MQQNALNIYASMQKEGLTGRALEAQVLTRAANMLKECQNRWGSEGFEDLLDSAVRFNQKVWTFFQVEVSAPDNPLPEKLKENILSLSLFVDKRLIEILLERRPELLTLVIDINMNIAAGLTDRQDTATAPAAVAGSLKISA